jgi:hypothetical protein
MIRTIDDHHHAAKRLFALAEQCRLAGGQGYCSLRRLNLLLVKAKLDNPRCGPTSGVRQTPDSTFRD